MKGLDGMVFMVSHVLREGNKVAYFLAWDGEAGNK